MRLTIAFYQPAITLDQPERSIAPLVFLDIKKLNRELDDFLKKNAISPNGIKFIILTEASSEETAFVITALLGEHRARNVLALAINDSHIPESAARQIVRYFKSFHSHTPSREINLEHPVFEGKAETIVSTGLPENVLFHDLSSNTTLLINFESCRTISKISTIPQIGNISLFDATAEETSRVITALLAHPSAAEIETLYIINSIIDESTANKLAGYFRMVDKLAEHSNRVVLQCINLQGTKFLGKAEDIILAAIPIGTHFTYTPSRPFPYYFLNSSSAPSASRSEEPPPADEHPSPRF